MDIQQKINTVLKEYGGRPQSGIEGVSVFEDDIIRSQTEKIVNSMHLKIRQITKELSKELGIEKANLEIIF